METSLGQSNISLVRKFFKWFLICLMTIGVTVVALEWLLGNEDSNEFVLFPIKQIKIDANLPINVESLEKQVRKLAKGKSLLSFKSAQLSKNLRKDPWIEKIEIRKIFPNSIFLTATTKQPIAIFSQKNKNYFVDSEGKKIVALNSKRKLTHDFPIVSFEKSKSLKQLSWRVTEISQLIQNLRSFLNPTYEVSQLHIGEFPYFEFFLDFPKTQVLASYVNLQTQVAKLPKLISRLPNSTSQTYKINLLFDKKAIVSKSNSH